MEFTERTQPTNVYVLHTARIFLVALPGGLIFAIVLYALQLHTLLHEDTVQGVGLTVGAMLAMLLAFRTRRSLTADRVTLTVGSLALLFCVFLGLNALLQHKAAVGWNRLPLALAIMSAATYGIGALCMIAAACCGMKARSHHGVSSDRS